MSEQAKSRLAEYRLRVEENELTARTEHEFVYKRASGVEDINLVVSVPASPAAHTRAPHRGGRPCFPVVFWVHGGGAVQGGLGERYQHHLEGLSRVPFVCVAPNYRCVRAP